MRIEVVEGSQVAAARREVAAVAGRHGLAGEDLHRLGLVVTELATNLVKHAAGGELLVRRLGLDRATGIEVLALDRGPGIPNIDAALRDGYSTTGSSGTGLGAVGRLSDRFQVHSSKRGTALRVALWSKRRADDDDREPGVVCRAKPGEAVSGDGWAERVEIDRVQVMVADGLGHGPEAAAAARAALGTMSASQGPEAVLRRAHEALRATRGAAVAVAEIGPRQVRLASVGNISCRIVGESGSRSLVSHNGIVGHELRRLQVFDAPVQPGALVVLHSDGLGTQWDIGAYPGLAARHAGLIAGVLYRDFSRERDDVTVVVRRALRD